MDANYSRPALTPVPVGAGHSADIEAGLPLGMATDQQYHSADTAPAARLDAAVNVAWCQLQSAVSYLQACEQLSESSSGSWEHREDEGQKVDGLAQLQSLQSHTARVLQRLGTRCSFVDLKRCPAMLGMLSKSLCSFVTAAVY